LEKCNGESAIGNLESAIGWLKNGQFWGSVAGRETDKLPVARFQFPAHYFRRPTIFCLPGIGIRKPVTGTYSKMSDHFDQRNAMLPKEHF